MLKNQNFLICLAGLPASGKTTFAIKLKIVLEKTFNNLLVKIVDPDIIRQKLTPDKFEPEKEQLVKKENLKIIKRELKKGHVVISDNLNYYSSMRHNLKEIADILNLKFFIIHIATPFKICLKWNEDRGEPIPNKIIREIRRKFDKFDKYSWDFPDATFIIPQILDIEVAIEKYVNTLTERLEYLEQIARKEKKKENHSNLDIEKLEKISRMYVRNLLQNSNYLPNKDNIIKLRRIFVKNNRNKSLKVSEITKSFKNYLEKSLNIKISENSF